MATTLVQASGDPHDYHHRLTHLPAYVSDLCFAATAGNDLVSMKKLLQTAVDVDQVGFKYATNSYRCIDQPSLQELAGTSALIWAARNGHTGAVQLLLAAGATIDRKDRSGRTAREWAWMKGHKDVVAIMDNPTGAQESDPPQQAPRRPTVEVSTLTPKIDREIEMLEQELTELPVPSPVENRGSPVSIHRFLAGVSLTRVAVRGCRP